jgi:hypothetical protein
MTPRKAGRALVIESDSLYAFEADVLVDGGLVHAWNVSRTTGRGVHAIRRPVEDRAWPVRRLHEIRWLDERVAA